MYRYLRKLALLFSLSLLLGTAPARAADPPSFTVEQLDQMLAPIALFPDALLSQVLMASTYPSQVAKAAEWAFDNRDLKGDDAVKAVQNKDWDPSVQSLVAFPQVLAMLQEKPQWVQDLGDAFLAQPDAVMDSVQFLRMKAKDAGNLSSNEQQIVTVKAAPPPPQTIVVNAPPPPAQIIVIEPAQPQVVFVPIYNPAFMFGPWWHPMYPPFFFPPPPRWGFGWSVVGSAIWWGTAIGVRNAMWGGVNWNTRNVNINVNQWNNININNRINSNDRNVNWNHNQRNRQGVPYRDGLTRDRIQQANPGDRIRSNDYRGREDQRDRARAALADRVGAESLNREALRDIDRSQLPSRPGNIERPQQLPSRPGNIERPQQLPSRPGNVERPQQLPSRPGNVERPQQLPSRPGNVERPQQLPSRPGNVERPQQLPSRPGNVERPQQLPNRPANVERPQQLPNRPANVERPQQLPSRPANVDRGQIQARPGAANQAQHLNQNAAFANRDNALRGAGNPGQAQQQIDRGRASQAAAQRRAQ
jgi:hypothetical protein